MFAKRFTLALALVGMGVLPLTSHATVVVDDFETGVPFSVSRSSVGASTGTRTGAGILGGVMDAQINLSTYGSVGSTSLSIVDTPGQNSLSLVSSLLNVGTATVRYDATAGFGNFTSPGLDYTSPLGAGDSLQFNAVSGAAFNLTVNIYDINNVLVATRAYPIGAGAALAQISFATFTTFGGFNFTQPIGAFEFVIPFSTDGLQFLITSPIITQAAVPEPATMALGAMGVLVLAGARTVRRRLNATA